MKNARSSPLQEMSWCGTCTSHPSFSGGVARWQHVIVSFKSYLTLAVIQVKPVKQENLPGPRKAGPAAISGGTGGDGDDPNKKNDEVPEVETGGVDE